MGSKAIKVSENTYSHLKKISEEKKVSMKELVDRLMESGSDIEDFKGSWNLSDEEVEDIRKSQEEMWKSWKI